MKVGDRVTFKGRTGTVTGFMPAGMTDVKFDDVNRVERRHESLLKVQARKNRSSKGPGLIDVMAAKPVSATPAANLSTSPNAPDGVPTWAIVVGGVALVGVVVGLAWALRR